MGSIAASCIASASALAAPEALGTLRWVHLEVSHPLQARLRLEAQDPFVLERRCA